MMGHGTKLWGSGTGGQKAQDRGTAAWRDGLILIRLMHERGREQHPPLFFFGREVAFAPPPFPNLQKSLSHGAEMGLVAEVTEVSAAPCAHCSRKDWGRQNLGWLSLSQLQTGINGTVTTLVLGRSYPSPPQPLSAKGGRWDEAPWTPRGSPRPRPQSRGCRAGAKAGQDGPGSKGAGADTSTSPHSHIFTTATVRASLHLNSPASAAPSPPSRRGSGSTSQPSFGEAFSSQQKQG